MMNQMTMMMMVVVLPPGLNANAQDQLVGQALTNVLANN